MKLSLLKALKNNNTWLNSGLVVSLTIPRNEMNYRIQIDRNNKVLLRARNTKHVSMQDRDGPML